jgi:hypothetical protein
VVASGDNGEVLRMPFSYRAVVTLPQPDRAAPFMRSITDDGTPDQTPDGVDHDGRFRLRWTYPALLVEQPCAFVIERATGRQGIFADDAEEVLVLGENATWSGTVDWVTRPHPDTMTNGYHPLYTDFSDLRLTLVDPIALPDGRATLSFQSSEDIEPNADFARVEASGNGGPFIPLGVYTGAFSGRRRVDLSPLAGQDVVVRFRFVTNDLMSAPLFDGWFIDDIALETSDYRAIATVDAGTFTFTVRPEDRTRATEERTEFFRVGGLFGSPCVTNGPFSNERSITVEPNVRGPQ